MELIASNAVIEGRKHAEETDLTVLKYVVPRDWDELDKVVTILSEELKTPYRYIRELEEIKSNIKEVVNYINSLQGIESKFIEMRFRQMLRDLDVTKERVLGIILEANDSNVERVANEVLDLINSAIESIKKRLG